ncbi:tripartite motif-containing protein 16-like [Centropristis striata]|uniref:tripartite motif-containing protein 16-like n=1 Tax=Centropristis striata TaxID=184440 RepID=UPI0027E1EC95|nr:tripartite motif-containing protein 16-like [Centropristis striata]
MAQRGIQMEKEKVCCAICLDLLKDPVGIPCGHSYCMNYIKRHWDEEDQRTIPSCPQCRQIFGSRPVLKKNTMLADLVELLKKTGLQAAPADHCYAGPEDVGCDVCTGRKLKALKSCEQCLVSYCEQHLQPHYESPAFAKHKLVDPSKKLKENVCTRHNEVMKIFCRTDQKCICYLCSMDEHKGHRTVSAAAERTKRQKDFGVSQQKIQQRMQKREKDVKLLQQEMKTLNHSADKAVEDSEKIFTDLIRLIEKRSSDVKQQIRSKQQTEVRRVKELQEELEEEISDLRRNGIELEQLTHTEDNIQFLQNCPSLSNLTDSKDSSIINIHPARHFEDVNAVVAEIRDKLQDILSESWTKTSLMKTQVDVFLPQAEPRSRADFLQYSCRITLAPNTANTEMSLSKGNRKATMMHSENAGSVVMALNLACPEPLSRDYLCRFQVLSRESLTGRCYWEVEWSGRFLSVAVTYPPIRRAGYQSVFGTNDKSWALCYLNSRYELTHNNITILVSGPYSSTVGVYLDHSAGILSFYSVSKTMTLIHRVQTKFTQPLYAGIFVGYGSTGELK